MNSMLILAGRSVWHFQANDDTRGGWLAVGVYLVLVFLCWREVRRHYSAGRFGDRALRLPFWLALSLFVTALLINKQLDLQVLLHEVVRDIALSHGFYEYRRLIGAAFVGVTAVLVGLVLSALWRLARRANGPERWVLIGTVALAGFVLIRVAGSNHIQLLGTLDQHWPLLGLELATLTFLSFAVWRNAPRDRC